MQNILVGDQPVPPKHGNAGFCMVMSDLVSLIDRVKVSIKLIEAAQAQHDITDPELADVVVLDDITPLYAHAGAALDACNTSLSAVLQFLSESTARVPRA